MVVNLFKRVFETSFHEYQKTLLIFGTGGAATGGTGSGGSGAIGSGSRMAGGGWARGGGAAGGLGGGSRLKAQVLALFVRY